MAYLDEPLLDEPEEPEEPDEPDEPDPEADEPLPLEPDCAGTELLGVAPAPGFSKQDFGIAEREAYFASSHFGSFFASVPLVSCAELVVEFTEDGVLVELEVLGEL